MRNDAVLFDEVLEYINKLNEEGKGVWGYNDHVELSAIADGG